MSSDTSINSKVAQKLREAADLLQQQGANPFRVGAYRRAASTIVALREDINTLLQRRGVEGLLDLPHIGRGLAASIEEILRTGRWAQLERLRGALDPIKLFQTVPGIGPRLARRIHDELHVDTLEALELAAHDGRLEALAGVGPRRTTAIRATLDSMLGRVRDRHAYEPVPAPSVECIFDVDREYREKAAKGILPTIAPRRFNPSGEAWLPILHTQRGAWHFTLLFSNTARAHELRRTRDWVVAYFYDDHHREGQHTIVTESRGAMAGERVVRGREAECREFYERKYEETRKSS